MAVLSDEAIQFLNKEVVKKTQKAPAVQVKEPALKVKKYSPCQEAAKAGVAKEEKKVLKAPNDATNS